MKKPKGFLKMHKALRYIKFISLILLKVLVIIALCFFIYVMALKYTRPKYGGPKYESELFQKLDDFSVKYGRKYNTELIDVGDFTDPWQNVIYGVWLRSFDSDTLAQGRLKAVALVNELWHMIQTDPVSLNYFAKVKGSKSTLSAPVLKNVGVKIAYWDKNTNRPEQPYLAEIQFLNEKFSYYQADPNTQALLLIHEESYETANSIINKQQS